MPLVLERSWLGRRVTVRRVVNGDAGAAARLGDVVGDLVWLDDGRAVIQGRAGLVAVPVTDITAAKLAPPSTADELALEAVAARGWRPEQSAELGGWVLRAAGGFTARANSILPLRSPGRPLNDALAAARDWYGARALPVRIQVPVEARRLLDAELAERGWLAAPDVHVLAARLDALPAALRPGEPAVDIADAPTEAWLARYRDGAGVSPVARALLTRHERVAFASLRLDDQLVAIGRGVVDDGWLGISAVEVVGHVRRRGLAQVIMRALWRWGGAAGAERSYLQVSSDNAAALALYDRLGYWRHHDYRYRHEPTG